MVDLPMFPLGSVLFPYMPISLRVFEERYLVMLARVLQEEPAEFGVVLIERGQEVGGGEHRFGFGTVARISQVGADENVVALLAQGDRRIEVLEWLAEDPHPLARVREIDDLDWDDSLLGLREEAERTVRRALARASEFVDQQWAADVELSHDPVAAIWQLAAIAPVGPLDQVALLRSPTAEALLTAVIDLTVAASAAHGDEWL